MKPDNYISPHTTASEFALMSHVLPDGSTEPGYLTVEEDGTVKWVPAATGEAADD